MLKSEGKPTHDYFVRLQPQSPQESIRTQQTTPTAETLLSSGDLGNSGGIPLTSTPNPNLGSRPSSPDMVVQTSSTPNGI